MWRLFWLLCLRCRAVIDIWIERGWEVAQILCLLLCPRRSGNWILCLWRTSGISMSIAASSFRVSFQSSGAKYGSPAYARREAIFRLLLVCYVSEDRAIYGHTSSIEASLSNQETPRQNYRIYAFPRHRTVDSLIGDIDDAWRRCNSYERERALTANNEICHRFG